MQNVGQFTAACARTALVLACALHYSQSQDVSTSHHPHGDFSQWDPRDAQLLDLGTSAALSSHGTDILVLADTQFSFLAVKDLQGFTCFILNLTTANVTSSDVNQDLETRGLEVIRTDFRPAAQLSRAQVGRDYGPRVAQFCLHNPTFLLDKAANTSPAPHIIGR